MANSAIPVPNDYNTLPVSMSRDLYSALKNAGVPLTGHESILPSFASIWPAVENISNVSNGSQITLGNGFIAVGSIFRLLLNGTGAVSIDTVDSNGTIAINAFSFSLPNDIAVSNIKEFKAETVVGIKITASATATVTYIG
jgi:hypothetical protein